MSSRIQCFLRSRQIAVRRPLFSLSGKTQHVNKLIYPYKLDLHAYDHACSSGHPSYKIMHAILQPVPIALNIPPEPTHSLFSQAIRAYELDLSIFLPYWDTWRLESGPDG